VAAKLRNFLVATTETTLCVCVFAVLFKDVSTRFGIPLIENSFKNAYATAVGNSSPFLTNLPFHDFPKIYDPQTKILEGRTNIRERIFKALFK
jgi:hypothetical protein